MPASTSSVPRRRRALVPVALTGSLLAAGQGALAQDPGAVPEGVVRLPQLEVSGAPPLGSAAAVRGFVAPEADSGTKTDTPLIATPQSVSVVPRDAIDARQAQTLGEAVLYNAGVRGEAYGADPRADFLLLRGFDAVDFGIYLNGLRYSVGYAAGSYETYGLQRFEIVRGPASVLYGQIIPGGLVNQVARRPTQTPQGEVRLSAGSFGRVQGAATASGPLDEDGVWSYSITALGRLGGTQVDHVDADRAFLAPALTWRPNNDTRLTFMAYYQRDLTQGAQFLPYAGTVTQTAFGRIPTARFAGEPAFDRYNITQWGVGTEFEHRVDERLVLRQNLGYGTSAIDWRQTVGLGQIGDGPDIARIGFVSSPQVARFQADNQAEFRMVTGPAAHTMLFGFDASTVRISNPQAFGPAPALNIYAPVYGALVPQPGAASDTLQNTQQYGLYAQDQIRLWERLVVVAGLRHDWVFSDTRDQISGTSQGQRDSATTGRIGLLYETAIGLSPYVSWSTSFLPTPGVDAAGQPFVPRDATQYEVGLKYQPPGWNSFVQASLFQITQTNALTADPANPLFQVQTGEVRVRGVELEAVANPRQGLNVIASFTYLDPEITKGAPEEVGQRPAGVPRLGAGLYVDYALGEEAGRFAGLGLGAGVRLLGNTTTTNTETHNVVPSVTLVDAAIRYDLGRLGRELERMELAVTASNLFDKQYVARCTNDAACFYGNRRTVLASLVRRW